MKTLSHVSLTGPRGERGWGMLPHPRPRLPVGGELFPIYIPVGEETSPSPSPNRGIPRGESRIGSPLPSLILSPDYPPPPRPHHQSTRGLSSFLSHPYIEKREEEIGIAEPDSGGPSGILVWREKRKLKHRFAVSLALPPSLPPTSSPLAFSSLSFLTLLVIATRAATILLQIDRDRRTAVGRREGSADASFPSYVSSGLQPSPPSSSCLYPTYVLIRITAVADRHALLLAQSAALPRILHLHSIPRISSARSPARRRRPFLRDQELAAGVSEGYVVAVRFRQSAGPAERKARTQPRERGGGKQVDLC
jgi:hypothetical protein